MSIYDSYPTALAVEISLKSSGFWPKDETRQILARSQAEIGAKGAADHWERLVGWKPFLMPADALSQVRPFNYPSYRGLLDLRAAAQEIVSVSTGNGASAGTLVEGRDYRLLASVDENDLAYEPPYRAIQFGGYNGFGGGYWNGGYGATISVNARWGYCSQLPGYAYDQILSGAKLVALTSIENLQSIGNLSVDGFSKAFDTVGIITQKDLLTTWGKDFSQAAALYTRVVS